MMTPVRHRDESTLKKNFQGMGKASRVGTSRFSLARPGLSQEKVLGTQVELD